MTRLDLLDQLLPYYPLCTTRDNSGKTAAHYLVQAVPLGFDDRDRLARHVPSTHERARWQPLYWLTQCLLVSPSAVSRALSR
jgi:hypothetical protein